MAGACSQMLGRGGKSAVASASHMSRNTVIKAEREVEGGIEPSEHLRAAGAGIGRLSTSSRGFCRLSTSSSIRHPRQPDVAARLDVQVNSPPGRCPGPKGFRVSDDTVGRILKSLGYSLQAPAKEKEGTAHPDRDAQFSYLNETATSFVNDNQPVISVDTKKKVLVGEFKNLGVEWQPSGEPTRVKTHDFVDPKLGRAVPYGVYDLANDEGWVSVGERADTAEFAVETIRRWWCSMGKPRFPRATRLLITADAGGSNGYRVRAWKKELAALADETGLEITVCHYPPGTSKWNKIEHRMFSFISMNWRGRPLESYRTIVELIGATTTTKGLRIRAERDDGYYETGVKVSDKELAALPLTRHKFHGDWNYTLTPTTAQSNVR